MRSVAVIASLWMSLLAACPGPARTEDGPRTPPKRRAGSVTLTVIAVEQPTVEIIQPKQNAFIPGIGVIVIEALASHPNGIERVEFRAGGNLLGIDNSPPYQQPWRVEGLSGPATIVISAYRALTPGAPGVDSVHVNVEGVTRL